MAFRRPVTARALRGSHVGDQGIMRSGAGAWTGSPAAAAGTHTVGGTTGAAGATTSAGLAAAPPVRVGSTVPGAGRASSSRSKDSSVIVRIDREGHVAHDHNIEVAQAENQLGVNVRRRVQVKHGSVSVRNALAFPSG